MCNSSCDNGACGGNCPCATTDDTASGEKPACSGGCENCQCAKADDPTEIKCPDCGGKIETSFTCPGYDMGKEGIYRCYPRCSNARLFTCEECGWHWQDELHPKAHDYAANEAKKPTWADYA